MEAARHRVCESTHLLDQETAVRSTMRHGLYNGKLDGNKTISVGTKRLSKQFILSCLATARQGTRARSAL